jgi:hypothetical protein
MWCKIPDCLGNQILHGMTCLVVESSMGIGRACSLNESNKKLIQNAGVEGGYFEN